MATTLRPHGVSCSFDSATLRTSLFDLGVAGQVSQAPGPQVTMPAFPFVHVLVQEDMCASNSRGGLSHIKANVKRRDLMSARNDGDRPMAAKPPHCGRPGIPYVNKNSRASQVLFAHCSHNVSFVFCHPAYRTVRLHKRFPTLALCGIIVQVEDIEARSADESFPFRKKL